MHIDFISLLCYWKRSILTFAWRHSTAQFPFEALSNASVSVCASVFSGYVCRLECIIRSHTGGGKDKRARACGHRDTHTHRRGNWNTCQAIRETVVSDIVHKHVGCTDAFRNSCLYHHAKKCLYILADHGMGQKTWEVDVCTFDLL